MQLPKETVPNPDDIELWLKVLSDSLAFTSSSIGMIIVLATPNAFKLIRFTAGRWRIEAERLNQGHDI